MMRFVNLFWRRQKNKKFELVTDYKPSGDKPQAIERLTQSILDGCREQTLLGVTG